MFMCTFIVSNTTGQDFSSRHFPALDKEQPNILMLTSLLTAMPNRALA